MDVPLSFVSSTVTVAAPEGDITEIEVDRSSRFAGLDTFYYRDCDLFDEPALDPGDLEQIVDKAYQVAHLAVHDLVDLRRIHFDGLHAQQLERAADRRQRIAQLVREHGQEFVLAPVGLAHRLQVTFALGQVRAQLVLAHAAAQDAAQRADQRRNAHRPLQHRDVAEQVHGLSDRRGIRPRAREHQAVNSAVHSAAEAVLPRLAAELSAVKRMFAAPSASNAATCLAVPSAAMSQTTSRVVGE